MPEIVGHRKAKWFGSKKARMQAVASCGHRLFFPVNELPAVGQQVQCERCDTAQSRAVEKALGGERFDGAVRY